MKHAVRNGLLVCLVSVTSLAASAQEFRIGYVNTERIVKEANSAKVATVKLEREFAQREKALNELNDALKAANEKFEQEAHTMPLDSQRTAKRKLLDDQEHVYQRKRQELLEDFNARKYEELQQIYARATKVVNQVAKAEKYNMILQEVVYVDAEHDITDLVLKALNAAE